MELWNAYTRDGHLTDQLLVRGEPIPDGLYHLVCEALVRHRDGSYLCMKRALSKPEYGGYYEATAGGSALPGEDKFACVKRELLEETGILCDQFTQVGYRISDTSHSLFYSFICTTDCDKKSVQLQPGETEGYLWISEEEFIAFVNSDRCIPSQKRRFAEHFTRIGYLQ